MTIRKKAAIDGAAEGLRKQLVQREADDDGGDRRQHDKAENAAVGDAERSPRMPSSESGSNQSRQKKRNSAIAVPRCMTTR